MRVLDFVSMMVMDWKDWDAYKLGIIDENGKRIRIYSMRVKKILNSFPEKKERKRAVISFDQAEQVVKEEYLGILRELRKRII